MGHAASHHASSVAKARRARERLSSRWSSQTHKEDPFHESIRSFRFPSFTEDDYSNMFGPPTSAGDFSPTTIHSGSSGVGEQHERRPPARSPPHRCLRDVLQAELADPVSPSVISGVPDDADAATQQLVTSHLAEFQWRCRCPLHAASSRSTHRHTSTSASTAGSLADEGHSSSHSTGDGHGGARRSRDAPAAVSAVVENNVATSDGEEHQQREEGEGLSAQRAGDSLSVAAVSPSTTPAVSSGGEPAATTTTAASSTAAAAPAPASSDDSLAPHTAGALPAPAPQEVDQQQQEQHSFSVRMQLRPLTQYDREALAQGLHALSPEARFTRFFSAMDSLPPAVLSLLCDSLSPDRFAWGLAAYCGPERGWVAVGVGR
jgi:hypothetical protein